MSQRGGPMMAMRAPVDKPKNFKATLYRLLEFTRPYRLRLILVFVMSILGTGFSIVAPRILGLITSLIFNGLMLINQGTPGASIDLVAVRFLLLVMAALYSSSAVFQYLQGYIMVMVTQKVTFKLRLLLSEKINSLPLRFYDSQSIGDVLSRITNDVDTIAQSFQQSISQVITALTTVIGILIMMLWISLPMTLIALITLPFSLFFVTNIVKFGQKYFQRRAKTLGELNGLIEESFTAHSIVKVFNAQDRQIDQFNALSEKLYKDNMMAEFLAGMMMPIISFVSNVSYVAVSVVGGYLVLQGSIQVGDIQAFIQYNRNFSQPINQIANIGNLVQSTIAAAERIFNFLDEENEVAETQQPVKLQAVRGEVSFEDVDFGYSEDNIFIKNLHIRVKPGQKVAIVGPTGAGKTTLINLLMRFYDVKSGSIKVDGFDIRSYTRHDLRSIFGMVLQDTWLFNGSIKDNIRFSKPHATDEEVIEAARNAKVDHFVQTLPDGYDLILNEEASNISQGQKQLLTIARAFLSDPSILILDEATSSVDTRTEVLIQKAMEKLMHGRTSFIIAHRLSTIREADLILVMNHGSIVELGKHQELIQANGFYATLYQSQFEPETT
jgi:ATP-binding cassette, subfamily B, multidrug efflux pump